MDYEHFTSSGLLKSLAAKVLTKIRVCSSADVKRLIYINVLGLACGQGLRVSLREILYERLFVKRLSPPYTYPLGRVLTISSLFSAEDAQVLCIY